MTYGGSASQMPTRASPAIPYHSPPPILSASLVALACTNVPHGRGC